MGYLVVEGDTQKVIDYGDEVWICPMCKRQDDGSPMIGCDSCDDWYHNACLKILTVPTGEWYCPKCEKKRNDQKKKKLCQIQFLISKIGNETNQRDVDRRGREVNEKKKR